MPKPISNIAVLQKQKLSPEGPTHDNNGVKIDSAYMQNHTYLSNPNLWPGLFANVIRRHDEAVPDDINFLGAKELGICIKTAEGWRVYIGINILTQAALKKGEDPKHHDYLTVDAMLDDGWEVD